MFATWIVRDLRFAFRSLRHSPMFATVAVASLALGIGANTAIFSFVNAILLKQLPVPQPNRLVTVAEKFKGETVPTAWRLSTVDEFAKRNTVFDGMFGWFLKPVSFSRGEASQWIMGELVTGQYFRALRVQPVVGRLLTQDDVRNAVANPVCVISYDFWQREFAGDPNLVGRSIFLNGHAYRVLGVTARGFYGASLQRRVDIQVPATRIGDYMPAFGGSTGVDWLKTLSWLTPMARLRDGIRRPEAQHKAQLLFNEMQIEKGESQPSEDRVQLLDGSQGLNNLRSSFGKPAVVLLAIAAVVLIVTCANLANLLLARAQARSKEFAVRLSIGASRSRLIQQLFVESLLIAVAGGVAGTILSYWMTDTLLAFMNAGRSSLTAVRVQPDVRVLAFSFTLSVLTAVLFGLFPAWQASKPEVGLGIRQHGQTPLRRMLVVAQIALSLTIIFAAGLLTRTLRSLQTLDLGFQADRVIALTVDPAANGHSAVEVTRILDKILQRSRALPGVKAASLASSTPYGANAISFSFVVPGYTPKGNQDEIADFNFISPDYFATLGQPLLRGRDFADSDKQGRPRVAIVNESFAKRYFRGVDSVGRKFRQGDSDIEIVGVVKDARDRSLRGGPDTGAYLPVKQAQTSGLNVLVRAGAEPSNIIPSLLAIVASIDRRMPVYSVHTLDVQVEAGLSSERILGQLSVMFAALATLIAGIGLYGLMAYSVTRRTREIGIRLSAGAQQTDIGVMFARESLLLVGLGVVLGVPLALVSVNVLKSLLFGVTATDPATLTASIAALLLAACAATMMPLRRATRVSPMTALRYDG